MEYDKELLKSWCQMEDLGTYLDKRGALTDDISTDQFKAIGREYFDILTERINACENILRKHKDGFVNYVLAWLHDNDDLDRSPEILYKRKVIYHCLQAIKKDSNFAPAWALLAESYTWVAFVSGDNNSIIWYIEMAITCIKKAIKLDPSNKEYAQLLKDCYQRKGEEEGEEEGHILNIKY